MFSNNSYKYLFKFIVVGESCSGKSSLLLQFTDSKFINNHDLTIGVDFRSRVLNTVYTQGDLKLNVPVKLQVFDCAGQSAFRSITRSYYRGAAGCLLVYDVTRKSTFNEIKNWLEDIKRMSNEFLEITLVANKIDLENIGKRSVTKEEGQKLAEEFNLNYIETSAKLGTGVEEAFKVTSEEIVKKIKNGTIKEFTGTVGITEPSVNLNENLNSRFRNCWGYSPW